MKLLLKFNDKDVGLPMKEVSTFVTRDATRAILFHKEKIAIIQIGVAKDYYLLPGGGVHKGETLLHALKREMKEETGCTIKAIKELGKIEETCSIESMIQTTYCYVAEVDDMRKPKLTEQEIKDKVQGLWMSLDEAIDLLTNAKIDNAIGKFDIYRDLHFLNAYREVRG